jgi:hypothetical protein
MSNEGAQHQLVGMLVERFPELVERLAEASGVDYPAHDRVMAAPTTHHVPGGAPVATDSTVRLLRRGRPTFFAHVEMQNEFRARKVPTLRAYHGIQVRKSGCGGRVFVLSPRRSVTQRFRDEEERRGHELSFQVSYLSGDDLAYLSKSAYPYPERALAAASADYRNGATVEAKTVLVEMGWRGHDDLARALVLAIIEGCPDEGKVLETMSDVALERLAWLPQVQELLAQATARLRQELDQARADAKCADLQARADAKRGDLMAYFSAKGEVLTSSAYKTIQACADEAIIYTWLMRAFRGETAAEIFPELSQ